MRGCGYSSPRPRVSGEPPITLSDNSAASQRGQCGFGKWLVCVATPSKSWSTKTGHEQYFGLITVCRCAKYSKSPLVTAGKLLARSRVGPSALCVGPKSHNGRFSLSACRSCGSDRRVNCSYDPWSGVVCSVRRKPATHVSVRQVSTTRHRGRKRGFSWCSSVVGSRLPLDTND